MENLITLLLAGIFSGTVISTIASLVSHRKTTEIEEELGTQSERLLEISRSQRTWKERSVWELLGPVSIQLDRTKRAFARWGPRQLYLEMKVIRRGNKAIRDLLLQKAHLIPSDLLDDAGRLIEHYDYWLEKFEEMRLAEKPDLDTSFVFAGVDGYPFPEESAERFRQAFQDLSAELYGSDRTV